MIFNFSLYVVQNTASARLLADMCGGLNINNLQASGASEQNIEIVAATLRVIK